MQYLLNYFGLFFQRRQTKNRALTLTSIVIMYIICNIPRLVLNLAEHLIQDEKQDNMDRCGCKKEPKWFTILCSISHFLLVVNSSANFIIYGSTENKFKKTLKDIIHSFGNRVQFIISIYKSMIWNGQKLFSIAKDTQELLKKILKMFLNIVGVLTTSKLSILKTFFQGSSRVSVRTEFPINTV